MRITTPLAILVERNPEDFNNPEQFSDNPMAQSQTVWFEEGGNACAMYTAIFPALSTPRLVTASLSWTPL
ncbi:hypothetical protein [Corynebacterium riegelii]